MDERILVVVQRDDVVVIFAELPGSADVRRFRSASISGMRRLVAGGCAGIRKKASKSLKAFRKFVRFSDVAGVIRLIRVTMLTVSLALVSAVVWSMSRPTITPWWWGVADYKATHTDVALDLRWPFLANIRKKRAKRIQPLGIPIRSHRISIFSSRPLPKGSTGGAALRQPQPRPP